jgi:hypothetical protein
MQYSHLYIISFKNCGKDPTQLIAYFRLYSLTADCNIEFKQATLG